MRLVPYFEVGEGNESNVPENRVLSRLDAVLWNSNRKGSSHRLLHILSPFPCRDDAKNGAAGSLSPLEGFGRSNAAL